MSFYAKLVIQLIFLGRLLSFLTTILVPLVFGVIVFVGAFGNVLVITVVATNQVLNFSIDVFWLFVSKPRLERHFRI